MIQNRLKPMTDKILEITIDSYVKANESAILLSLDFTKAFDSLGHTFIKEVLKLYQIPENFVNVIMGYLSNNLSCIMLDSGRTSQFFEQVCDRQWTRESAICTNFYIGCESASNKVELHETFNTNDTSFIY